VTAVAGSAFAEREAVEETTGDCDRHLARIATALRRLRFDHRHLSENEVLALRANLLEKADRWLDCRNAIADRGAA
jgi:hypothetical protein